MSIANPTPEIEIMLSLLKKANEKLKEYFDGNEKIITELEDAIQYLDDKILEVLVDEPPQRMFDYFSQKVEFYLKLEELKVRKETSFLNLLKNWSPVIIPVFVGVMTVVGVVVGQLITSSTLEQQKDYRSDIEFERQLIIKTLEIEEENKKKEQFEMLMDANLIVHNKNELENFISIKDSVLNVNNQKDSVLSIASHKDSTP